MATGAPNIAGIALQLEVASTQLRGLSSTADSQLKGADQSIMVNIKLQLDGIQGQVSKLQNEVQSLRDTSENRFKALEAATHNDKMRVANRGSKALDSGLKGLRNIKTNEAISGLPSTARKILALDQTQVEAIGAALDWSIDVPVREGRRFLLQCIGFTGIVPKHL